MCIPTVPLVGTTGLPGSAPPAAPLPISTYESLAASELATPPLVVPSKLPLTCNFKFDNVKSLPSSYPLLYKILVVLPIIFPLVNPPKLVEVETSTIVPSVFIYPVFAAGVI